ncbi:MAG: GNAT family N-acetyltransferase [Flavobacteriales bacterium]|nr:GNAT family N-acetyltransferase [Flavobacteriales bacterium]
MVVDLRLLAAQDIEKIIPLTIQSNKDYTEDQLYEYLTEMFMFDSYLCFGLWEDEQLIGVSSGWITVKLYSGKQLEVDNFVIDEPFRKKGYGQLLLNSIEDWAYENDFNSVELNAYVYNHTAHKFYVKSDYKVIGYHYQKKLKQDIISCQ